MNKTTKSKSKLQIQKLYDRFMAECHKIIEGSKSYSTDEIMNVVIKAALNNRSVESVADTLRDLGQSPSADVVRRQILKFLDKHELESLRCVMRTLFIKQLKNHPGFKKNTMPKVKIAIDLHDEEFYGKMIELYGERFTMYSKSRGGYANQFATLSIVEIDGQWQEPLTIDIMLNYKGKSRASIVKDLIDNIELDLDIELVLVDGGFISIGAVEYLDEKNLHFIGRGKYSKKKYYPGKVNSNFKYELANKYVVEGYLMKNKARKVTGKEKFYKVFLISDSKKRYTINKIKQLYRKRFRIENTYKQSRQLNIRTSTRNLKFRYFYWVISQYLELLWEFCHLVHYIQKFDLYLVRIDRFKDIILELTHQKVGLF